MLKTIGQVGLLALPARALADAPVANDPWPGLVTGIFQDRKLEDGTQIMALNAPVRAENAAIVPVSLRMHLPPGDSRVLQKIWLVVDQNPSPLVGTFTIGRKSGMTALATRVRVDAYSNVHAVAGLSDGRLYMVKRFVKAAGGCSAPMIEAMAPGQSIGQMRFREVGSYTAASPDRAEGILMIRHPNNSGMQMDQVTLLYIPTDVIERLDVWQGKDLIMSMDGGISIAQNPHFRFNYIRNGSKVFRARARDTKGKVYEHSWSLAKSST
ncbi:MAG: quinoprotein dehydrogenase-associated SoxYZ-like carrier [Hyphomicrobiales bacterium]|nr:quinoprotein dehydrogenase-associated SoxYZ-like carrier [Hyphomicrobiales bacterium]